MKKIKIEIEIISMNYWYSINFDEKNKKIYFKSIAESFEKNINEEELNHFWNKIDELNIWGWSKSYEQPEPMCDGVNWQLKLRNNKGKNKYSSGQERYPDNFNDLIETFDNLIGLEYDEENRFFDYDED